MVSFDAGFLSLALHPQAKAPFDPSTNLPTAHAAERIEALLEDLDAQREKILIATPALAEFLVLADDEASLYLKKLMNLSSIYIRPFDQRAAIETAAMELLARKTGSKRHPASKEAPWQKVKVDRQIVAIAKVEGVHTLYSDDQAVRNMAEAIDIQVVSCWELTLPPSTTPLLDALGNPIDVT